MQDVDNTIRTFWHGAPLSQYEKLCISSFLEHGHQVQLFAYTDLDIPEGAKLVDANTVLPESQIFTYTRGPGQGSYAAFANLFRYRLLQLFGGTWVDTDVVCLKPFNSLPEASIGLQNVNKRPINNAVIRLPAGHPLAKALFEQASAMGQKLGWGQTGTLLLSRLIHDHPDVQVLDTPTFYPLPPRDAWRFISPEQREVCEAATADSYAVHWWHEEIRRMRFPKDRLPPQGSWLYEQMAHLTDDAELKAVSADSAKVWVEHFHLAKKGRRVFNEQLKPADILREVGLEYIENQNWQAAAEVLDGAHRLRPSGPYIRLLLALALVRSGRQADAKVHLEAASSAEFVRENHASLVSEVREALNAAGPSPARA